MHPKAEVVSVIRMNHDILRMIIYDHYSQRDIYIYYQKDYLKDYADNELMIFISSTTLINNIVTMIFRYFLRGSWLFSVTVVVLCIQKVNKSGSRP